MHVDNTQAGQVDDGLGDDLSEAHHHHRGGVDVLEFLHHLGTADSFGLADAQPQAQSGLLDRRWRQLLAPALGTIRLGVDGGDFVSGSNEGFERGDRELGGT